MTIALGLLIAAGSYLRVFDSHEFDTLDMRFRLRPPIKTTNDLVIIEIDSSSIEKLGMFPFDRSYHGILIKALQDAGAKAVIFDIFFSEPSESDNELEQSMITAGNVYLPFVLNIGEAKKDRLVTANGFAAQSLRRFTDVARGSGHINVLPDSDGKFRKAPLYIEQEGAMAPYLSFLVARDILGIKTLEPEIIPGRYIRFGQRKKRQA